MLLRVYSIPSMKLKRFSETKEISKKVCILYSGNVGSA
jgi:hypothetical protein